MCQRGERGECLVHSGSGTGTRLRYDSGLFNRYMHGVVRKVNKSVLGRDFELLEANGRSWQSSQLLSTDDAALVA